ncbi:AbrB/MazE/SpoVT family DNA-binding domain-containing protein [Falsiroseomonas sp. E2-1-a20]|uniref:AbrB/MazE/SpoVT family DNA-binding domain-containing protein n=1 Tax=Falsiroseomonas sp. E2-1-a20 TaxID=3239300 RepID=UPI003F39B77A
MGRVVTVQVDAEGRLVLPEDMRVSLGVQGGGEVTIEAREGRLHLRPSDAAIRRAQALVAAMVPPGHSLADELIAERRAEAARDLAEEAAPHQNG